MKFGQAARKADARAVQKRYARRRDERVPEALRFGNAGVRFDRAIHDMRRARSRAHKTEARAAWMALVGANRRYMEKFGDDLIEAMVHAGAIPPIVPTPSVWSVAVSLFRQTWSRLRPTPGT